MKNPTLYWQCEPGIGLIRCVSDARYRKFSPRTRMRYSPVLMVEDEALIAENQSLRKAVKFAAEAFETITSGDGSGHADLAVVVQRIAGGDSAGADVFRKDAERYRWLRARLIGVLRDWDDSGKGVLGLSFIIPGEAWRSCDENIDAAMAGAGE